MTTKKHVPPTGFRDLGLSDQVLEALDDVGYETPTPIQLQTIPIILEGGDILGQAQTGTGKTAAFALPLLSTVDLSKAEPQVLVLTPTRELAIQVAEAFQRYAAFMDDFHVLPIYGGQDYSGQLRRLKRGVHVVVGTPGRVMDHIRRKTLVLDGLKTLVLDEADEMLRMGFVDDVEWILDKTPASRQVALFSATMPSEIRRISRKYLRDVSEIAIKAKSSTVETITQRFLPVSGQHKLDALTRILEIEHFDGIILFVRTKTATLELSEKLRARGYAAAALNGDMVQKHREKTIGQFKGGEYNMLVATDVAARGLDVERISHVINYDIPTDTESYVHRIGRTGRAGRSGEAILFVTPREMSMLRTIEKAIRKRIDRMELPSTESINDKRIVRFKQQISDTLSTADLGFFRDLVESYCYEHEVTAIDAASALASLYQGDTPLLISAKSQKSSRRKKDGSAPGDTGNKSFKREKDPLYDVIDYERYRLEVGEKHGVKPGNIAGAIINEIGVESGAVGRISIFEDYSTVELPEGMPKDVLRELGKVWVCGQQLRASRLTKDFGGRKKLSVKDKRKPKKKSKRVSRVKGKRG
ncbi:DEAD/DEAH box helicase [Prosthecochloris sp. SCSIO W1103]|uniref:DEAD/DEAH box helicase n=1 Tax=Prosthecochloris sp. SCSIO W1103 TaxID=2992244 RepID=UPI00223D6EA6|nr:DEAD/DEAH box helicase [Prosthecochloris sp. SCSIO W1103]UZJ36992.1 DEAD/DEAH box helicase [Prosthecochloris sp. SCSIO W1103]